MIRRYTKPLDSPAMIASPHWLIIRHYQGEADQDRWISIHQEAFQLTTPWNQSHFTREFCQKAWWDSSRMWLAFEETSYKPIGTVCLGERISATGPVGIVGWLQVIPPFQRRGVARLLMNRLERDATRRGYDRLELETLPQWNAANQLYQKLGFAWR